MGRGFECNHHQPVLADALQGIRNVPTRLRIQISRRRNDDEDAKVSLSCTATALLSHELLEAPKMGRQSWRWAGSS